MLWNQFQSLPAGRVCVSAQPFGLSRPSRKFGTTLLQRFVRTKKNRETCEVGRKPLTDFSVPSKSVRSSRQRAEVIDGAGKRNFAEL